MFALTLPLRLIVGLLLAGVVGRAVVLTELVSHRKQQRAALPWRERLLLDDGMPVQALTIRRPADGDAMAQWRAAWSGGDQQSVALVADAQRRLWRVAAKSLDPDQLAPWLDAITPPAISDAGQPAAVLLGHDYHWSVLRWDANAAVYLTAGPDGAPGIAGVDDNGDGIVDHLSELGATGSDDRVVAPGQQGYRAAARGDVISRVVSRGALVPLADDFEWSAGDPASEVWVHLADAAGQPVTQWLFRLSTVPR